jgi:hypothetical protein
MMMLQKYQFEHKDCSHISCNKYTGNALVKNYKSSNSQKQRVDDYTSRLLLLYVIDKGDRSVTIAMGAGHIMKAIATEDHSSNGRVLFSNYCY